MNLLAFTQGYPPDPMSVGQHLADVAAEMVRRGHRVTVLTADRGYDDPSIRYPARETIDGVEVVRLPFSSLGKGRLRRRALAAVWFHAQCGAAGLLRPRVDAILASTVPPFTGTVALVAAGLRRIPFAYWVMDLNPDQLVALRRLPPRAPLTRVLEGVNRIVLKRASRVIALDRFMESRLRAKADLGERLSVVPPWPHEDVLEPVPHDRNPFRREHDLEGRFVFMYSGNHTPTNPLATLLEATRAFRDDPGVVFLFVGGGHGKPDVDRHIALHRPPNVISLPYQPLERIRYSLSAADVHLVSLGDELVGLSHPCKVYGAMAVARPVVFLGPEPSHMTDLLQQHRFGWRIAHGDVEGAVRVLRLARATSDAERAAMGERARAALAGSLSQQILRARVCDRLEEMMAARAAGRRSSWTRSGAAAASPPLRAEPPAPPNRVGHSG